MDVPSAYHSVFCVQFDDGLCTSSILSATWGTLMVDVAIGNLGLD